MSVSAKKARKTRHCSVCKSMGLQGVQTTTHDKRNCPNKPPAPDVVSTNCGFCDQIHQADCPTRQLVEELVQQDQLAAAAVVPFPPVSDQRGVKRNADVECPICLDVIAEGTGTWTNCFHAFHVTCLQLSLTACGPICPECRHPQ